MIDRLLRLIPTPLLLAIGVGGVLFLIAATRGP